MKAPISIRPLERQDHPVLLEIYHQTLPPGYEPPTVDEPKSKRYVALDDNSGRIVGFGSTQLQEASGFILLVKPSWQRKTVGTLLWQRLEQDLIEAGLQSISSWVREENLPAISWARKNGFTQVRLDGPVSLFPETADLSRFQAHQIPNSIKITTLTQELEADQDCLTKVFELYNRIRRDVPGESGDQSWDDFMKEQNEPERMPDAYFIAKDGAAYIGLSYLRIRGSDLNLVEPAIIQQCLTGVRPAYRRQGIALALKLKTIDYARDHDFKRVFTNSDNPAMKALNIKMGFQPGPWFVFEKALVYVGGHSVDPKRV